MLVQLSKLFQRIKDAFVRDVPPEMALCEFDCPKNQCLEGEWASCERRLTRVSGASGTDFPASRDKK
jgi:hypothetical protein